MSWWQIALAVALSYLIIGLIVQPLVKRALDFQRLLLAEEQAANRKIYSLAQKYHNHTSDCGLIVRFTNKAELDEALGIRFLNNREMIKSIEELLMRSALLMRMIAWPLIALLILVALTVTKRDTHRLVKELSKLKNDLAAAKKSFESLE